MQRQRQDSGFGFGHIALASYHYSLEEQIQACVSCFGACDLPLVTSANFDRADVLSRPIDTVMQGVWRQRSSYSSVVLHHFKLIITLKCGVTLILCLQLVISQTRDTTSFLGVHCGCGYYHQPLMQHPVQKKCEYFKYHKVPTVGPENNRDCGSEKG